MSQQQCDIDMPANLRIGTYANAIRIIPEIGGDFFLDFCVYSAQENRAQVVARVRVRSSFLPIIMQRMQGILEPPSTPSPGATPLSSEEVESASMENGMLVLPDGRIILMKGDPTEN